MAEQSLEDVDLALLFSDDDSECDTNPDNDDWDSPSSETGRDSNETLEQLQAEATPLSTPQSSAQAQAPAPITASKGFSTKKKQLNKHEKKRLVEAVRQTDIEKLLRDIVERLNKQLHFTVFEERGLFLQTLNC